MRCMRCGSDNPSGYQFCRLCGSPLPLAYYQPPPPAYHDTTQSSIERAILWIVIAIVLMVVVGAIAALLWFNSFIDQLGATMVPNQLYSALTTLA